MLHNLFSLFWAMEPNHFAQWKELLTSSVLPKIAQGPVDDAERVGLPVQKVGNVSVISLEGVMVRNAGMWGRYFGLASTDHIRMAMLAASTDDDIEYIVMKVNSPGGSVDGLAEAGDVIAEVNKIKPVIVQVEGMMCSAAVYLGSQASKIYAGRMDMIGSIGTKMMLYDLSEKFEKDGIKSIAIDTGKHKSAGAMGTKVTDEQIAEFQRIVDVYFDDFLSMVVKGRGISREELEKYADGRVYFAEEAVSMGLIDGISTIDKTLLGLRPATSSKKSIANNHNKLKLLNISQTNC
ncbi:MAG: S49 family peptidase [Gammaproteobacteria bacterium]|nr:S49 family peptidase [Gammaproteobacteria bacterium]MBL4898613.1 S49 family peptidase [Colwellia sp.]